MRVIGDQRDQHVRDSPHTVRRGQGYTLRVSAIPAIHRQLLALRMQTPPTRRKIARIDN
ncbi:hypothetical protein ACFU99_19380 [Streptomyces sp. NPDC057654]|uniref:hypothetical protein n=1 Tax=Streptomyces sp. NPDC057654 TaxID=3346196 RepID=UPI0036B53532